MGVPQTLSEEMNRSIWSRDDWITYYDPKEAESARGIGGLGLRFVRVRDYKDKFILRMLQEEARKENPGFKWFDDCSQDAVLTWTMRDGTMEPMGYILVTREFYDRKKGSDNGHWYPYTLNQLFVRKGTRRNGIGTGLLSYFIKNGESVSVWVESPKWETQAMLSKLGYKETRDRYEVWQMREGLTLWTKCRNR
jgi:GNAT superfamily N-acetyltransferase